MLQALRSSPKSQEAGEQAPFEVDLVPCSGLFKVPFSWSIAGACLQEMRSVEVELTTTAQYQGKSLEPVNHQLNWPRITSPCDVNARIDTYTRPTGLVDTIGLRQVPSMSQEKARRLQGWPCLENGQGRRGRNPRSTATHGSCP